VGGRQRVEAPTEQAPLRGPPRAGTPPPFPPPQEAFRLSGKARKSGLFTLVQAFARSLGVWLSRRAAREIAFFRRGRPAISRCPASTERANRPRRGEGRRAPPAPSRPRPDGERVGVRAGVRGLETARFAGLMPGVRRAFDFRMESTLVALPKANSSSFGTSARVTPGRELAQFLVNQRRKLLGRRGGRVARSPRGFGSFRSWETVALARLHAWRPDRAYAIAGPVGLMGSTWWGLFFLTIFHGPRETATKP
jgi:hypothetical protein